MDCFVVMSTIGGYGGKKTAEKGREGKMTFCRGEKEKKVETDASEGSVLLLICQYTYGIGFVIAQAHELTIL